MPGIRSVSRISVHRQKVGCDMRVGSNKNKDICGVCGGNGSSCQPRYSWSLETISACSKSCGSGECKFIQRSRGLSQNLLRLQLIHDIYRIIHDNDDTRILYLHSTYPRCTLRPALEQINLPLNSTKPAVNKWTGNNKKILCHRIISGFKMAMPVCKSSDESVVDDSSCNPNDRPNKTLLPCNTHPCSTKWVSSDENIFVHCFCKSTFKYFYIRIVIKKSGWTNKKLCVESFK